MSFERVDDRQIRARDVRPKNTAGPRSIAGVASLLAMATTHGQGTEAEAMLFRQLLRTAQAIYSMHQAVDESRRAAEIRSALGERLDLSWDSVERRETHVEAIKAGPDQAAAGTPWKQADVDQAGHPSEAVWDGREVGSPRTRVTASASDRRVVRDGR